ncbi:hypothetical protein [Mycobacteroides abscessus]|uniref:hypothetical protein n=1 Tax=Mycobacteroides abscessus TaxID=36809 RepID=UPI0002587F45|nr:hypothetical protein [Mycobacteroides abscessus]QSM01906.1 hypothetical protein PROPHIGD11-3_10 [Mycobacterium phage prophiGD11-3]QSM03387.1 hypothetical protein PROPHIGD62-2_10 [Mycobacterium phage prophi62-2]QSM04533.1 hypothetical protein PROPHIGD08-3_10 [Mycobacterium phage prophiGD08-3]EIC70409.1 hypothetical protein S7W_05823 [Mycobacteroides abscessus M94]MBE5409505.1 hypothetical protein [Mycobacteroides abscessus]
MSADILHRALTEAPSAQKFFDALTAADGYVAKVDELGYLASFAPPPIYYGQCVCGSVFEIRPSDGRVDLTGDDCESIRDWDDLHSYCQDGAW